MQTKSQFRESYSKALNQASHLAKLQFELKIINDAIALSLSQEHPLAHVLYAQYGDLLDTSLDVLSYNLPDTDADAVRSTSTDTESEVSR